MSVAANVTARGNVSDYYLLPFNASHTFEFITLYDKSLPGLNLSRIKKINRASLRFILLVFTVDNTAVKWDMKDRVRKGHFLLGFLLSSTHTPPPKT